MPDYTITVGDWSDDGHGYVETVVVRTNKPAKDIRTAHDNAVRKSKISLIEKRGYLALCVDYQDNRIPAHAMALLRSLGVSFAEFDLLDELEDENDSLRCTPKDMARLYMEMARTQLPDLTYALVDCGEEELVKGIGYGVFDF